MYPTIILASDDVMRRVRTLLIILLISLSCGFAPPESPIVIRHDRDDAQYLELGSRFPAVPAIGRAGDGTLIRPQWILTAAHVAMSVQRRDKPLSISIGGGEYTVIEVVIHPEWTEMGPHDVGLLRLERPVTGVEPLDLYRKSNELGKRCILVGHGDTRTGEGGSWAQDGKLRGATSDVERVDMQWLYFVFDEPPKGTDLEGAPGRGDSGGPAILEIDGRAYVAAVSSLGTDGKHGPGTYGAEDSFVRVSSHAKWILDEIAKNEKSE